MYVARNVAPLAGAWIEISCFFFVCVLYWSLLSQERGLKFSILIILGLVCLVAPLAGAWIEILEHFLPLLDDLSRSSRRSVD